MIQTPILAAPGVPAHIRWEERVFAGDVAATKRYTLRTLKFWVTRLSDKWNVVKPKLEFVPRGDDCEYIPDAGLIRLHTPRYGTLLDLVHEFAHHVTNCTLKDRERKDVRWHGRKWKNLMSALVKDVEEHYKVRKHA